MSCNSNAYAVVGIHISEKALEAALEKDRQSRKTITRGCNHEFSKTAKFCPECGKPRDIEILPPEVYAGEFLDNLDLCFVSCTDHTDLFVTTDKRYIASTDDINAGITWEEMTTPTTEEVEKILQVLKEKLMPYNLYNDNIKIWVVGNCSY